VFWAFSKGFFGTPGGKKIEHVLFMCGSQVTIAVVGQLSAHCRVIENDGYNG